MNVGSVLVPASHDGFDVLGDHFIRETVVTGVEKRQ